jgi:GNAT superfamily N-acetyltransferase
MIRIRLATPEDSEDLQAIQEQSAIGTDLMISPVNAPDFFARTRAYQQCQIFVACDGNAIVGSAACALRTLIVGGEKQKVGYEFQYITAPDYQKRGIAGRLRKQIEAYLKERGASFSYCLIMENNLPSMHMCERNGFELYRTLVMPIIFVNRPVPAQSGALIRPATSADLDRVADLMNETWRDHDFYEQMSGESLDMFVDRLCGHSVENIFLLEKEDRIVACLGFWDLSKVMQVTVRSLSMKLYATRLLLSLVRPFRPIPLIPGRGEVLKQYYLIPMGYREPAYLNQLLCHLNNVALTNGARQLLWICERDHPLMGNLEGFWRESFGVHFYVKRLRSDAEFGERPVFVDGIDL